MLVSATVSCKWGERLLAKSGAGRFNGIIGSNWIRRARAEWRRDSRAESRLVPPKNEVQIMKLSAAQMVQMSRLLDEALPMDVEDRQRWLAALPGGAARAFVAARTNSPAGAIRERRYGPNHEAAGSGCLTAGQRARQPISARRPGRTVSAAATPGRRWHGRSVARAAGGRRLKRDLALKMPVLLGRHRALADRFARERDLLAALEHPNIARLYDAGVSADGVPYIALEYVDGEPLTTWCERRGLSLRQRLQLFLQVLEAVQYTHDRQIVHRDLKPSNMLVTAGGQVRLLDFGVAKLVGESAASTGVTHLYGPALTPEYASPELARGDPIGRCADVSSLGVVLSVSCSPEAVHTA